MAQDIENKSQTPQGELQRYADPFKAMRSEMERVFDRFMPGRLGGWPDVFGSELRTALSPHVDVRDEKDELVIEAELPGIAEKDVEITFADGLLSIKGEKKSEREENKDNYRLQERSFGSFQRSFRVPDSVDEERIKAVFDKGVLRITMTKKPHAVRKEKKIAIGKG